MIIEKVLEYMNAHLGFKYSKTYRMKEGYFDCSSFVYRAYKAAGITLTQNGKAVSTSCYEVYAEGFQLLYPSRYEDIGKSLPSAKSLLPSLNLQPGDHIFMNWDSKTTRANKITHVCTVNKGGGIIHARNPQKGVCKDPLTYGDTRVCAVIRYIEKGGEEDLLKKGDKGVPVKEWQEALLQMDYTLPKWGVDGDFGQETETATNAFKKSVGLPENGIVDTAAMAAMLGVLVDKGNLNNAELIAEVSRLGEKINAAKNALN